MSLLRVLWFTNTPSLAIKVLEQKESGGGWIKELDRLIQKEVELHVAFYSTQKKDKFKLGKTTYHPILKKKNVFKKILKYLFNTIEPLSDINLFLDIVQEVEPDIIHVLGSENPFGLIQKQIDIPVIVSMQGIITVIKHKFFTGIEEVYSKKTFDLASFLVRKNAYHSYKQLRSLAEREKEILQSTKYIIGRTDWDKYVTSVLAPKRLYFHNDEILRNSFYNNKWQPLTKEKLIIHTTTNPSFYKGFETIVLAAALLEKLGINFVWKIAGIISKDVTVKTVFKKYKEIQKLEKLKLLGELEEDELVKSMLNSSIYVSTSHIENSPNNICEAMLLGLPIIASYAGGTSSMLKNNSEGILVQEGDPWGLAGAIINLYSDKERAAELGIQARNAAFKRHNKTKIVTEIVGIYKSVHKKNNNTT